MVSAQFDKRTGAVPPGLVMMALGSFRFGMRNDACQRFSHSAAWRWNKVDRIGREPALQYLGPDAREVTIEGVIHPHFKGGPGRDRDR